VELCRQGIVNQAVFTKSLDLGHCSLQEALAVEQKPSDLYEYLPKLN